MVQNRNDEDANDGKAKADGPLSFPLTAGSLSEIATGVSPWLAFSGQTKPPQGATDLAP